MTLLRCCPPPPPRPQALLRDGLVIEGVRLDVQPKRPLIFRPAARGERPGGDRGPGGPPGGARGGDRSGFRPTRSGSGRGELGPRLGRLA